MRGKVGLRLQNDKKLMAPKEGSSMCTLKGLSAKILWGE